MFIMMLMLALMSMLMLLNVHVNVSGGFKPVFSIRLSLDHQKMEPQEDVWVEVGTFPSTKLLQTMEKKPACPSVVCAERSLKRRKPNRTRSLDVLCVLLRFFATFPRASMKHVGSAVGR